MKKLVPLFTSIIICTVVKVHGQINQSYGSINVDKIPNGIYILKVTTDAYTETQKLSILK